MEENPDADEKLYVGIWVDDLSICHSSNLIGDWFINHLRKRFIINEKATGELSYMLSARITRDRPNRVLYMDQSAAITRVAEKCGLANDEGRKFKSPMSTIPLSKHLEKSTDFDYLSIVGSVLHICGVSRPDCAYSISCLARHSKTAGVETVFQPCPSKASELILTRSGVIPFDLWEHAYNARRWCAAT